MTLKKITTRCDNTPPPRGISPTDGLSGSLSPAFQTDHQYHPEQLPLAREQNANTDVCNTAAPPLRILSRRKLSRRRTPHVSRRVGPTGTSWWRPPAVRRPQRRTWSPRSDCRSRRSKSPTPETGGSACCYWNRYRTQCNHPAQRDGPRSLRPRACSRIQHPRRAMRRRWP